MELLCANYCLCWQVAEASDIAEASPRLFAPHVISTTVHTADIPNTSPESTPKNDPQEIPQDEQLENSLQV